MAWCKKWVNGSEFPDGVEVTLGRDGNVRRYIPERTCEIEDCYFEDEHYLHRAMDTDEWFGAFGMCSLCGEYIPVMNYCPNCGAKAIGLWRKRFGCGGVDERDGEDNMSEPRAAEEGAACEPGRDED